MKHNPYRLFLLVVWVGAGLIGGVLWLTLLNSMASSQFGDAAMLSWAQGLTLVAGIAFACWFVVSAILWSIHDVARRGPDPADES